MRRCVGARSPTSTGSTTPTCSARTARSRRSAEWQTCPPRRRRRGARRARALRDPGLVDCHTHLRASRATASRSSPRRRCELRGAARGRWRHPLDRARDARATEDELERAVVATRGCSATGTTTFEGKSGYGLTGRPSSRPAGARAGAASRPGSVRTPSPEFDDADGYLDFALSRSCPRPPGSRRRRTSSSSAGRSTRSSAPLPSRRVETPGSRCDSTATSSASPARFRSRSSSAHAPSTISRRPEPTACARSHRRRRGVLLPASALVLGRPMLPAPSARRRRSAGGARDGLQSRERVLREPSARLRARRDAAPAFPRRRSPRAR